MLRKAQPNGKISANLNPSSIPQSPEALAEMNGWLFRTRQAT